MPALESHGGSDWTPHGGITGGEDLGWTHRRSLDGLLGGTGVDSRVCHWWISRSPAPDSSGGGGLLGLAKVEGAALTGRDAESGTSAVREAKEEGYHGGGRRS